MLTKTSIKKPFTVIVLIVVIAIIGGIAVFKMPLDLFPEMDLPYMIVATMVPGASSDEVEQKVTTPIEESVMQVNNVKEVTSMSTENISLVIMELSSDADLTTVTQDIDTGLKGIKGSFPSMTAEPIVMKIDANMMPVMTVAISKKGQTISESSEELARIAEKVKSNGGVASVSTTGAIENSAFMQVDAAKLLKDPSNLLANAVNNYIAYNGVPRSVKDYESDNMIVDAMVSMLFGGETSADIFKGLDLSSALGDNAAAFTDAFAAMLTPELISQLITAQNFEMPAGTTTVKGTDFYIKVGEKAASWDEFKSSPVFSLDLAETKLGTDEASPTLGDTIKGAIAKIYKQTLTEEELAAAIDSLMATLGGEGIEFNGITIPAEVIKTTLKEIMSTLLYSKDAVTGNYNRNEDIFGWLNGFAEDKMTVEMQDIAYMYNLNTASTTHTIINGAEGIMLSVFKSPDASTTDVTKGVESMLKDLSKEDANFNYIVLNNQGDVIEFMMQSIAKNLLLGALFAVLVLLIFLRDWKPTVTVGMSIVISLVTAFALMYLCGVTLNLVSMGGLALSVGMLVDNSIVVIENIYRKRNEGASGIKAAYEGTKQVAGAIVSSTVTTVIVFLPIMFVEGITRSIMMDLALTIAFSLFASLIIALTFVPMVASRMLGNNGKIKKEAKVFVKMKKGYAKSLNWMLGKKWLPITLVVVLFATSIATAFFMEIEFLPTATAADQLTITASVDKSMLGDNDNYDEIVNDIIGIMDDKFREKAYVKDLGIELSGGFSAMGMTIGGGNISAYVTLNKKPKIKAEKAKEELEAIIEEAAKDDRFPEGAVKVGANTTGNIDISGMVSSYTDSSLLGINIYGDNTDDMIATALELEKRLNGIGEGVIVNNGLVNQSKEFKLVVDKVTASRYGLTTAQVYLALYNALNSPTASASLNLKADIGNAELYIYGTENNMLRWYRITDKDGVTHRAYFDPADDTDKAEYFYLDGVGGTKLKRSTVENVFEFKTEEGDVFTCESNAVVYYDNSTINEVDMVTLIVDTTAEIDMSAMSMAGEAIDYEKMIPIYKLLKVESFATDADGNVMYRNRAESVIPDAYLDYYDYDAEGYWIFKGTGERVPQAIAMRESFNTISHTNGKRVVNMTVKYDGMSSNKLKKAIGEIVDKYNAELQTSTDASGNGVASRISVEFVGTNEMIADTFNSLILMLVLAVAFIYLVMVAQFQSLKSPFIIMFTIPLALTGSLLTLQMCGMPLSIFALVGIILLVGVVVNNGIVYVDYVNKLMASGMSKREALLKTAEDRIRPILMTALTTICAMLISVFDTSSGAEAIKPMAITTVGGLVYATFLTLYFVPIMYDIFNRKEKVSVIKFDDDKEVDIEAEMHMEKFKQVKEVLEESNTLTDIDRISVEEAVAKKPKPKKTYGKKKAKDAPIADTGKESVTVETPQTTGAEQKTEKD